MEALTRAVISFFIGTFLIISSAHSATDNIAPPSFGEQSGIPAAPAIRANSQSGGNIDPGKVLIKFIENTSDDQISDAIKGLGKITHDFGKPRSKPAKRKSKSKGYERLYTVKLHPGKVDDEVLRQLNADPRVQYAQPNYIYSLFQDACPNNVWCYINPETDNATELLPRLWGLNNTGQGFCPLCPDSQNLHAEPADPHGTIDSDIDVVEAWSISEGSPDIVVAVVDTGVDTTHPDLKDNLWVNPGEIPGDGIDNDGNGLVDDVHGSAYGYLTLGGPYSGEVGDCNGHGTHVAGTIAAANNNIGVIGVAPKVKIMAVNIFCGTNRATTETIVKSIQYAVNEGADVMNNSWGCTGCSPDPAIKTAFDDAISAGVVVVAAAGNSYDSTINYPAAYPDIISVAATNSRDIVAPFSTYNAAVDISAPGTLILSTLPTWYHSLKFDNTTKVAYGYFSGTSMAAPHVSGVAALLRSMNVAANDVEELLKDGAQPIDDLNPIQFGKIGAGRLNAYRSLKMTETPLAITHTSDIDFAAGTLDNIAIQGAGASAGLLLKGTSAPSTIPTSSPQNPVLLGTHAISTASGKPFKQGNLVYLNSGTLFQVFDISSYQNPFLKGSMPLEGGFATVVVDNYAYTTINNGLVIVDVSNPAAPQLRGQVSGINSVMDVRVSGNYAYLSGDGITVVDISNKSAPTVENYLAGNYYTRLAIKDQYLYAFDGITIFVYNLTNPASPSHVNSVYVGINSTDMVLDGNYLYMTAPDYGVLMAFNISAPQFPTFYNWTATKGRSIAVSDGYAYLSSFGLGEMEVIDVRNVFNMTRVALYTGDTGFSLSIAANDGIACLINLSTSSYTRNLVVLGVGATSSTQSGGSFATNGIYTSPVINTADASSNPLYSTVTWNAQHNGQTVKVRVRSDNNGIMEEGMDKAAPKIINRFGSVDGWDRGLLIEEGYAYLTNGSTGLRILELSDPAKPQTVGSIVMMGLDKIIKMGNFLIVKRILEKPVSNVTYTTTPVSDIVIIDVSDKENPVVVSSVTGERMETPCYQQSCVYYSYEQINNPVVVQDYLYLRSSTAGTLIYSILASGIPILEKTIDSLKYGAHKIGNLLVNPAYTYSVIDVSDPLNPLVTANSIDLSTQFGSSNYYVQATGIAAFDDNLMYVIFTDSKLRTYDVSNYENPVYLGEGTPAGSGQTVNSITVTESRRIMIGTSQGFVLMDMSDPASPAVITRGLTSESLKYPLTKVNSLLYTINGYKYNDPDTGAIVVRLNEPAWVDCMPINSGDKSSSGGCVNNSDAYLQYQVELQSSDGSSSPEFDDISINYWLLQQ